MRWGGLQGDKLTSKDEDDPHFSDEGYMWKPERSYCSNKLCRNYGRSSDLILRELRDRNRQD